MNNLEPKSEKPEQNTMVAIATLGNQDLQIDGKTALEWRKLEPDSSYGNCRSMGETLIKEPIATERISFPILEPFLRLVQQHGKEKQLQLTHLVLVATDQESNTEASFLAQDTYPISCVIHKCLKERPEWKSIDIRLLRIKSNPVDSELVAEELSAHWMGKKQAYLKQASEVLLSATGGVPNLNLALFFSLGVEQVKERLTQVYVPKNGLPRIMPFVRRVHAAALKSRVEALASTYDFAAISREVKQSFPVCSRLAAYGSSRLGFDFESASYQLTQARQGLPKEFHAMIDDWATQLEDLKGTGCSKIQRS